jgi:glycosyltransferase involved in cell wall biosynthesis
VPRTGVLFIGRLETAQKGLDLLLDAWARLDGLGAELVVAGDGPDRERLENRARSLGVNRSVRFVGWLDGDERFAHLAAARLVVVPSRFETFGMVALEAFVVGTPVVAFDIPCLRDIVPEQCGRLVPAFDVAAFAAAIDETYRDEQWLTAAAGHTRHCAERYAQCISRRPDPQSPRWRFPRAS